MKPPGKTTIEMNDQIPGSWQEKIHTIVFESSTPAGKAFDVTLLVLIVTSIVVVMLDSISGIHARYGRVFLVLEWGYTILFTIEFVLRLICIKRPFRYVLSFFGIIDLLSIVPTYIGLIYAGAQTLLVVRALRLLRVFRIFKLRHYVGEMQFLLAAIKGSIRKISIFMLMVFATVIILGSVMYLVERGENGFTSIPDSIYWAIVTITTVGYGDISPVTPLGKVVASVIMLMGYGIIAVPTGIITTEMAIAARQKNRSAEACPNCGRENHDEDAEYCKYCGSKL
jgi:voltage-gated potassium channel